MMKRVLIRADDLGYSEAVNYGLAKTVKEGLIRSVGVMPNMPYTKAGLELIRGEKVCLGQHTNVCVGRPLTDPSRIPSLVNENGEFKESRQYRSAENDFVVVEEAVLEIEAQYERYRELTGDEPHYFEAHAVASDNLFKALEIVAENHHLPYLPCALFGPVTFRGTTMISGMDSLKENYDPFESLKTLMGREYSEQECPMFICHPGWLDQYILTHSSLTVNRTKEVDMLCDPAVRRWLEEQQIELVTYDDIR